MVPRIPLNAVCTNKVDTIRTDFEGEIEYIDISAIDNVEKNISSTQILASHEAPSRARQLVKRGDILVSTVRPNLNAVAIIQKDSDLTLVASTGYCVLRCNSGIDSHFVFYFCQSPYFVDDMVKQATGASYPAVSNSIVKSCLIPVYDFQKQQQIASVLDKLTSLISLRKQQLAKQDELVKARFVEMFGDMLLNPLAWRESLLETMADIVSGITKGRKTQSTELVEVPYMAVSNVKAGYIDWTTVKTIMATKAEIDQYRILPNDVLMTEGGDPDKLGRGAIIQNPPENCIHQNHVFRVRFDRNIILPVYFAEYLQHQKAKHYFLRCAKQTTGIASINMKQLRALPVLVPPIDMQEIFAEFVEQVGKWKLTIQQSLDKMEVLKKSLMQEYFG